MGTTLAQLAELVSGKLVGDPELLICGAATIRDAAAGEITLADKAELLPKLTASAAVAAIVPAGLEPPGLPYIQVASVSTAFAQVVAHFRPPRQRRRFGISPAAYLAPTVRLAENVEIHPGATIADDVHIGTGTTIHAGVHLMAG